MRADPNLFTIAPGSRFLTTVVDACLSGALGFKPGDDQRNLSGLTIYVPTRRAARALAFAFTEALSPDALLLPTIRPLGDPSDAEDNLVQDMADVSQAPVMGELDRRFALAHLVEGLRKLGAVSREEGGFSVGAGFADSFAMAADLARLIDEATMEGVDFGGLSRIVPPELDVWWQTTQRFLSIAGETWPAYLTERGLTERAAAQIAALEATARRLRLAERTGPVIAAGSTGSVPATAALLATIARLDQGAVILPGLDVECDSRCWEAIGDDGQPGHPQAALKALLKRMGADRTAVRPLWAPPPARVHRVQIAHAAMRPASVTDDWPLLRRAMADLLPSGTEGLSVLEAANEQEEALAIAISLRGVLEVADRTAMLVTPDRALASRVAHELKRWGLSIEDSAGQPLHASSVGGFARLVLEIARSTACAGDVMAVLAHPALQIHTVADLDRARRAIDLAGFRGKFLVEGPEGWAGALKDAEVHLEAGRHPRPTRRLETSDLEDGRRALSSLYEAIRPLIDQKASAPLGVWASHHAALLGRLITPQTMDQPDAAGVLGLLDDLATVSVQPDLDLDGYAAIFESACRDVTVSSGGSPQGRIKILGLLEARLLHADQVILAGLNEGMWPPEPKTDPFLNRTLRNALGLSPPERRIGQSAHDFVQLLGAPEALITRAAMVEGEPKVASRFLRRLDAFLGGDISKNLRERSRWLTAAAARIDAAPRSAPAIRPEPKPSASVQPEALAITDIETLYRDPYAIYARHILKLDPLDPSDEEPGGRERGTIIHDILAQFIAEASERWPDDPLERLLTIGREAFAPHARHEQVRAFWWPSFTNMATWFVDQERARRPAVMSSVLETKSRVALPLADGTRFTLTGKPDRIDVLADGGIVIMDYKTGAAPSSSQVYHNYNPQLTLAAAMALKGAFEGVEPARIHDLFYLKVGTKPELIRLSFSKASKESHQPLSAERPLEEVAERHLASLIEYLNELRLGKRGYLSRRLPQKTTDRGDYDHLARVAEWDIGDEDTSDD